MPRALILAALLVALAAPLSGCRDTGADSQLIVTGSTTLLPIAEQAAQGYQEANEGTSVLVSGLGSSAGIEAVSAGTSDIGTSSRDLKEEEGVLGLVDIPVAFDGIAVIVSPENPVDAVTTQQLQDIFSGKIRNWQEVGGENRRIDLVNRDEASGTREAFKKIVMADDARFDRSAVVLPGTGQVRDVVSHSEGAIGYISVGFVEPRFTDTRVKALKVDGVEPSEETVTSKEYPIARTLHFFTKGEPQGLAKSFIDYVLSSEIQNGVVVEAGFVPVTEGGGE
ncbi:MAG TPA: phosphate ABC transporter substrate-binding protein [Coriobacteriia bacterium]|nr:phosphate ABC transporter substrate-binding protein [Coriobacteriia bacterium]